MARIFAVRSLAADVFATLDGIPTRPTLLLVLVALIAFGGAAAGSFHLDDYSLFVNPDITNADGWWRLWAPLQTRPLTNLTYWLNYQISGRDAVAYQLVDLALHLTAVLVLFDVLKRLMSAQAAFLGAAIFAVHPMQAEAVEYVFARGTLLAAALCLASFRAWMCGRRWVGVAWFAAALLAKEECVAFPVLLLLLHWAKRRERAELGAIGTMFGLSLVAGLRVMVAAARTPGSGAGAGAAVTAGRYALTQGTVIPRYLRMAILPWGFTADPDIRVPEGWIAALGWASVVGMAILAWRWFRNAGPGFWFLGGIVLLLPSSSVFPATDLAADRRMYLPMTAFAAALALLLQRVDRRVVWAALAVLTALSVQRTMIWHSELSLWTEAAGKAPRKLRPKLQLARALPPERALPLLEEAKTIAPEDSSPASEEGRIYLDLGEPARALAEFGEALALEPGNAEALNNRGVALLALGQNEAARQDFVRALAIDGCEYNALVNLKKMGVVVTIPARCRFTQDEMRELE